MRKGIEIYLPVIKKSKITGHTLKRKYKQEKFYLDMSLAAEDRFDSYFPETSKAHGGLVGYSEFVQTIQVKDRAWILTALKSLYCWFDTKYSFKEFLQFFVLSDINYISDLVNKINVAFNLIMEEASQKN